MAVLCQHQNTVIHIKERKIGVLRFKPRSRYRSVNYNQSGFKFLQGDMLKLSKIGKTRCVIHRKIEGTIKGVVVKKDLDGRWFATAMCEGAGARYCSLERKKIVGLDVGVTNFIYDSDGHKIGNPQNLKKSEKRLKRAQRKLSGKAKESSNRHKQRLKLAKIHKRVANQRRDFEHKVSRTYVDKYDTIFVEDLSIDNMVKNHRLAKSIADALWNLFFQKLPCGTYSFKNWNTKLKTLVFCSGRYGRMEPARNVPDAAT